MTNSQRTNVINTIVEDLVQTTGRRIFEMRSFTDELIILENFTAAVLAVEAKTHNKQPEELFEAFCKGVKERFEFAIYGPKQ